jgi:hypothetical protein
MAALCADFRRRPDEAEHTLSQFRIELLEDELSATRTPKARSLRTG